MKDGQRARRGRTADTGIGMAGTETGMASTETGMAGTETGMAAGSGV